MKRSIIFWVLLFVLGNTISFAQQSLPIPAKIEAFFDRETLVPEYAFQPGQSIPIAYYNLSFLNEVNPKINEELTKLKLSHEEIKKLVKDTIGKKQPIFGINVWEDAKLAYEGARKLERYQITQIPAIVFDGGKSVVLGVTDVGEALRRYGEWRKTQP